MTLVPLSAPIKIFDPEGEQTTAPILLMPSCPMNLLGKDLMTMLNIGLIPDEDGQIRVHRMTKSESYDQLVLKGQETAIQCHTLDLCNTGPGSVTKELLGEATATGGNTLQKMKPQDLLVTMWFTRRPEQHPEYTRQLKACAPIKIQLE